MFTRTTNLIIRLGLVAGVLLFDIIMAWLLAWIMIGS